MTSTLARTDALLDRIDAQLAATNALRDQALALVADNTWCVKALGRRGLVPANA